MISWMGLQRLSCCSSIVFVFATACNPYDYQRGEFNAGPVDAANFPKPYQGEGADSNENGYLSGRGKFNEVRAFIGGMNAGYYSFPFTATQLRANDPLLLPMDSRRLPVAPKAYVFDPAPPSPFPASELCTPPRNYQYNPRTDDVHLDVQGNIFTQLPLATERPGQASTFEYIPVVAEIAVSAAGLACQSIKSERTLNSLLGSPDPTGRFLLWAIIDTSSGVYRFGEQSNYTYADGGINPSYRNGIGVQKWGWYGRYFLAYIDGSYIPTVAAPPSAGAGARRMTAQKIYVPLKITPAGVTCGSMTCQPGLACASPNNCVSCTANPDTPADLCPPGGICCPSKQVCVNPGANGTCAAVGGLGNNYDVLQYRRSDPAYSPVCEVWQYTANTTTAPVRPVQIAQLPKSEADILALGPIQQPTADSGLPRYLYCPQVD